MKTIVPVLVFLVMFSVVPARAQDHKGFTALFTAGYGLQWYNGDGPKEGALSGLNVGIGGFLSQNSALMLRTSGTYRSYHYTTYSGADYDNYILSGVVSLDYQWWATRKLNFEFGAGLGVLSTAYGSDQRYGLFTGAGYAVLTKPGYGVQLGVEFAPTFKNDNTIRSLGFNLGFQFY